MHTTPRRTPEGKSHVSLLTGTVARSFRARTLRRSGIQWSCTFWRDWILCLDSVSQSTSWRCRKYFHSAIFLCGDKRASVRDWVSERKYNKNHTNTPEHTRKCADAHMIYTWEHANICTHACTHPRAHTHTYKHIMSHQIPESSYPTAMACP